MKNSKEGQINIHTQQSLNYHAIIANTGLIQQEG